MKCGCACENCTCAGGDCKNCGCGEGKCTQGACCKKKCGRLKILVAALLLASGPMVAGYFVGNAIKSGPIADRHIEVNVSAEKEVKSDYIVWRIDFQNTSNDMMALHDKFMKDRGIIINFLNSKGFKPEQFDLGSPRIVDLQSLEYGKEKHEGDRYVMKSRVKVTAQDSKIIEGALGAMDELLKQGIVLSSGGVFGGDRDGDGNPKYFFKDSLETENALYGEAIHQGVVLAKQMAENLGVKLGKLRQVIQDKPMEILGNESMPERRWDDSAFNGPIKVAKVQLKIRFDVE